MKKKIADRNVLYPTPVTIVGALVNGKKNFLRIAHSGILNAGSPHEKLQVLEIDDSL